MLKEYSMWLVIMIFLLLGTFIFVQYYLIGESFLNAVAQFNNNNSCSRRFSYHPYFYYDHSLAPHVHEEPSIPMNMVTRVDIQAGAGSTISAPTPSTTEHFYNRRERQIRCD